MSSETITRTDLTNILNEVLPTTQGHTIYKGAWTSSGTSAYGVRVTEELTLDKGLYAIEVIVPVPSATFMVGLHVGSEASTQRLMYGGSGDAYERSTFLCEIPTDGTKVATYSEASASVTYSSLDRGGIHAIQLVRYYASPEVDYIVEQGTSGDWHYRVWNSGFCELDGSKTGSFTFTNWGNLSYTATSFSALPFSLASVYSSSVAAWSQTVSCWAGLMTDGSFRIYSNSGAGGPHSITCVRHVSGQKQ